MQLANFQNLKQINWFTKKFQNNWRKLFKLDYISWIILVISILAHVSLWIIRIRIEFSPIVLYYSLSVLILNVVLSFVYFRKDSLVSQILLSSCLLVQIFVLVLIRFTTF
mgnify:CR=1 FL=1